MKRIINVLVVCAVLLLGIPAVNAEALDIEAPSYILIYPETGQVLAEKNADQIMYPASITKLMTAIISLEKGELGQILTAGQKAIDDIGYGGMNIGIMAGEQIPLVDLLNALLLSSANEAANILADSLAPSRQEFVDAMNAKAKEIGAVNTHFVNPSGMHDDDHYSTVRDMAKIAMYALKNPTIRSIIQKKEYQMPVTNKHSSWDTLKVANQMHWYTSDYYTQVTGMKTGYTSQAGNNLVATVRNSDGFELMAVVFGVRNSDPDRNLYCVSRELLEYGYKNYSLQEIAAGGTVVTSVQVEGAESEASLDLVTGTGLEAVLPLEEGSRNIKENIYVNPSIKAPVRKGETLGYVDYVNGNEFLGRVNLIASGPVEAAAAPQPAENMEETKSGSIMKQLITAALIVLLVLPILRFSLKKISRMLHTRRQES